MKYLYVVWLFDQGCNGTFGEDCINPCPTNCEDGKCDTITGHCISCALGYRITYVTRVCFKLKRIILCVMDFKNNNNFLN